MKKFTGLFLLLMVFLFTSSTVFSQPAANPAKATDAISITDIDMKTDISADIVPPSDPNRSGRAIGDDCNDPFVVDFDIMLPRHYEDLGQTTCGRGNDYAPFPPSFNGEDAVYEINIGSLANMTIYVDGNSTGAYTFALFTDCPPTQGGLMWGWLVRSGGLYWQTAYGLAPGTYYLVIDNNLNQGPCVPAFDVKIDIWMAPEPAFDPSPFDTEIDVAVGTIPLTWTLGLANTPSGNYTDDIQVLFGTEYPPTDILVDWSTAVSSTLADVDWNQQYFWQVNSRNYRDITYGEVWGFTTEIKPPGNLTATVSDLNTGGVDNDVTLIWETSVVRALIGYDIYRNDNSGSGFVQIATDQPGDTYEDIDAPYEMTAGVDYYVIAHFDEGYSDPSNTVNVLVNGLGTFNGVSYEGPATTTIVGDVDVHIEGVDPDGTTWIYDLTTDATTGAYTIDVIAGTYTITGSKFQYDNDEYTAVVVGEGATVTQDLYLDPWGPPTCATDPVPVDTEQDVNANNTVLYWTLDSHVIEYRLMFDTEYPPTAVMQDWTTAAEEYTLPALEPNLQYFWQVQVRNMWGEVTNCNIWGFTTTITVPEDLTATVYDINDVLLEWESSESNRAFNHYVVYRDGSQIATTTEIFYNDMNLAYNPTTCYTYNVEAIFDEGDSDWSDDAEACITGLGDVEGYVYALQTSDPIEGATVYLDGNGELGVPYTYTFTTDVYGYYEGDVMAGNYAYTVSADGYLPATLIDAVAFDATTKNDFYLDEEPYPIDTVIATELNDDEVHLEWSFDASRDLEDYSVYRGLWNAAFGNMTYVGNTTQSQFIDYDWGVQTSGVYKWAVVVNYTNNSSEPTYSNLLDKDMETLVNIEVELNTAESPEGAMIKFVNTSEPYLELEYTHTFDATGLVTIDPFRKGIYDIEVGLFGYQTIYQVDVAISAETDLSYLLYEIISVPENLYVNPNGFATWDMPEPGGLEMYVADRSLQSFKVWLDDILSGEPTEEEWDYEANEVLVEGQVYHAEVAAVFTTDISDKAEYWFTYHSCAYFDGPASVTADVVIGTMNVLVSWTPVAGNVSGDDVTGVNVFRDGVLITMVPVGTNFYVDEQLGAADYEYCITNYYVSQAQSCQVCDEVTVTPGGYVNGYVMEFAPGNAPIAGAQVVMVATGNPYTFTTDANGYYEGEVVAGTYDYVASATGYASESVEDIFVDFGTTVSQDFELKEFPYPVGGVVATEIDDNSVLVDWRGGGNSGNDVYLDFEDGMPTDFLVSDDRLTVAGGNLVMDGMGTTTYASGYYDKTFTDFVFEFEITREADASSINQSMGCFVRSNGFFAAPGFSGYAFVMTQGGYWWYAKYTNNVMADWTGWQTTTAINTGLGTSNIVSIEAAGSTLQYFINGTLIHTVVDTDFAEGYCTVMVYDGTAAAEVTFDYYSITSGAKAINYDVSEEVMMEGKGTLDNCLSTYDSPGGKVAKGVTILSPASPEAMRALVGFNIYRGPCSGDEEDMVFRGFTLDSTFTDNTWGAADWGIYKWAVETVYDYSNTSAYVYSNCLDKDMETLVTVEVTTNSGDSPEGTEVVFTNVSEPTDPPIVFDVVLDASGIYSWTDFRKGTYDIYVHLDGFADINVSGEVIVDTSYFEFMLEELLAPPVGLYVTPTGFATWFPGGTFLPYFEDFNDGLPDDWTIIDGGSSADTWFNTDLHNGGSLDGTPFMFVSSDAAGNGSTMDELLISPVIENTKNLDALFVEWDQNYQNYGGVDHIAVEVFDGDDWVEVFSQSADDAQWPTLVHNSVDVTEYANDAFQVRFHYFAPNWAWYWGIDNVAVTEGRSKYSDRMLEYYKVWHEYAFITDRDTTFYQYGDNGEVLVPGATYMAEVAALYSTGMSPKMQYEWIYMPCDSFPGPAQLFAEYVIDSNPKDVLLTWTNTMPTEIVIINEPFEDYDADGHLAEQAEAMGRDYWTTWSGAVGGSEDPIISNAQAYEGTNSVVIEGTNDAVLLLDNYTEGIFNVDFEVYVPTGKTGYFNLLQLFAGGSSIWGTQTFLNPGGVGLVDAGGEGTGNFTYTYDTWHHVSYNIDLDNDFAEMFFNGTSVVTWVWSTGAFGQNTLNEFNAMNLYAHTGGGTPGAYFDNIRIVQDISDDKSTREVVSMGTNVYRFGDLIAYVEHPDTTYLDEALEPGYYDYCVATVYTADGGAHTWTSCPDALCVNDVPVPEDCNAPQNLTATLNDVTYDTIYLEWHAQAATEFRYDDGVSTGQLGFNGGTTNAVLGAVHRVDAELTELSWFLTDNGGPHATVTLYVMGLDGAGLPDGNNVLFTTEATNVDMQWNTFTLNTPLDVTGGFYLAAAYAGFVGVGTDDGVGAPWVFVNNTHYYAVDYTAGGFATFESINFSVNAMLRASGMAGSVASYAVEPTPASDGPSPEYIELGEAVPAGMPNWTNPIASADRAFEGYNIYRDGNVIEQLWQATTYVDADLVAGNKYCYEITAKYTVCGESEPSNKACIDGYVGIPELDASEANLYPNPAREQLTIEAVDMTRLYIVNYVGQVVYDSEFDNTYKQILNTANYQSGVYVARIHTEHGVITKRFVINR